MKWSLVVALCSMLASGCGVHTRPFRAADGTVVAASIASMEWATIGGIRQRLWFRGEDRHAPALILLHAGPGVNESAMFRHYDPDLERRFLVVYWEQRGAGRSYAEDIPPETMTIAQFLRDLDEVVDLVRVRFGKEKVVLLGHSWGSVLGTIYAHDHPEKVSAYVGVGQIADVVEGVRLSYEHVLAEAEQRGDERASRQIRSIGPRPRSPQALFALWDWVERYGGAFHADLSMGDLVRAMLLSDEANLDDLLRLRRGVRFSIEHVWPELSALSVTRYRSFAMPVFFLLGRHDWLMPSSVAAGYFATIDAPCKRLVWFEQSGHYLSFEEPDRFEQVLSDQVRPLVLDPGTRCPPVEEPVP
jgi:pimeloyl-ACP methyl ester carboxylesterase